MSSVPPRQSSASQTRSSSDVTPTPGNASPQPLLPRGNIAEKEIEPASLRFKRRALTIGRTLFLLLLLSVLLPILLPLAVGIDIARSIVFRTPATVTRLILFMYAFLLIEAVAMPILGVSWLVTRHQPARFIEQTFEIQKAWNAILFQIVQLLFDLDVQAENLSCVHPGPTLIFIRHSSIVDVLLPVVFVGVHENVLLRFVLKRELLQDPCLDIAGQRLPNYFVSRHSGDAKGEVDAILRLSKGMQDKEGLLIYPEGTRFSPKKLAEALSKLEKQEPELAQLAREFKHVLPPRLGGSMALLQQGLDVVFMAHVGLENLTHFNDLWQGGLVRRKLRIKLWRVKCSEIPSGREARARWLFQQWREIDRWIDATLQETKRA